MTDKASQRIRELTEQRDEAVRMRKHWRREAERALSGATPAAWRYRNELDEVVSEWIDGPPPEYVWDACTDERIAVSSMKIDVAYTVTRQASELQLAACTKAAGAIIDIMTGGNLDWRSRIDQSDFLESADWQTACAYAHAALSAAGPSSAEVIRLRERVADLSRMLDEASYADLRASGGLPEATSPLTSNLSPEQQRE